MEDTLLALIVSLPFVLLVLSFWLNSRTQQHHKQTPPSPPALPVIGHLHLIKNPLHRSLQTLSNKYGPIIYLQLGTRPAIVISSPAAVEECLNKKDTVFANRPVMTVHNYMSYNSTTMSTSPYGDHFRNLRRLSSLEVFSSNRLNTFVGIRRDEIKILLNKLYCVSKDGFAQVKLKPMLMELTFNTLMRMLAGKRFYGEDGSSEDKAAAEQFRRIINEALKCAEASYIGDYLPIFKWIDSKFLKKVQEITRRTDEYLQGLIEEHRSESYSSEGLERKNTMISHLLDLQESEPKLYSDQIIKGLLLDILFAGTETIAIMIEWVMCNLLNNLEVLEKAKNELETQVGQGKLMEESDISKLPYLQNIITETLRLYPSGPLLLPHLSSQECTIGGYHVKPNTILLVNAWAIQRDPKLWDDADKFKPERFESSAGQSGTCDISYKLLPFGLGRRSCPGISHANRVLGFALGSLIHCFEWRRVNDQEVDMAAGIGLTTPKAEPLEAMCKTRDVMMKVMSSSL